VKWPAVRGQIEVAVATAVPDSNFDSSKTFERQSSRPETGDRKTDSAGPVLAVPERIRPVRLFVGSVLGRTDIGNRCLSRGRGSKTRRCTLPTIWTQASIRFPSQRILLPAKCTTSRPSSASRCSSEGRRASGERPVPG
jgi:hypothetical protein